MLGWSSCPAVERAPGKVSGEWLFRSTRVPVRALFENLEGDASVVDFLEWFPGVTRAQVVALVVQANEGLAQRDMVFNFSNCRAQQKLLGGLVPCLFVRNAAGHPYFAARTGTKSTCAPAAPSSAPRACQRKNTTEMIAKKNSPHGTHMMSTPRS